MGEFIQISVSYANLNAESAGVQCTRFIRKCRPLNNSAIIGYSFYNLPLITKLIIDMLNPANVPFFVSLCSSTYTALRLSENVHPDYVYCAVLHLLNL